MLFIKLFSLQLKTSSGKSSVSVTYFSSSSPVVKNFDCCPGSCFSGVHNIIINTFREHTKLFFTNKESLVIALIGGGGGVLDWQH